MPENSDASVKAVITRLEDQDPVTAPRESYTPFTLIGDNFSKDMVVYISKNPDGSGKIDVEVFPDTAASTKKFWPVSARPASGVDPTDPKKPLWVAIKRNNQFECAYQGFIVV
jgi:hypothetical protein